MTRHGPSAVAARHVAIFLAALVGFEWLIDRVSSPFAGADKVEKKFAYFAAHKDEFDVAFVGSSRVMNQISPRVFDETMAAAGHPVRSINLGYAGMFLPETHFLVERLRELRPAGLRTLLIELSAHTPRRDEEQVLTAREIYWHRPAETMLTCAEVISDPAPDFTAGERIDQIGRQGSILARCLLHLGSGADRLEQLLNVGRRESGARVPTAQVLGPDLDGFSPLQTTLGQGAGSAKTGGGATDQARYRVAVAALRAEENAQSLPAGPSPAGAKFGQKILRDIVAAQVVALRKVGIEPVYFVGPGTTREKIFLDLAADGIIPKLLAFNDPTAYPELYQRELRADRYHLNARGAVVLSRLLAERLSAARAVSFAPSGGARSE